MGLSFFKKTVLTVRDEKNSVNVPRKSLELMTPVCNTVKKLECIFSQINGRFGSITNLTLKFK